VSLESTLVLASVGQGDRLRQDAARLSCIVNAGRKLLLAPVELDMGAGLKATIVGPLKDQLEALQTEWDKFVKKKDATPEDHAAAIAAYLDESVPNLSSIVVLAELGGKRILLTGDARGDFVLEGLKAAGVLDGMLHLDVLKVPHHGSSNNLTRNFFERITANHYVFSGNGEHGNPEREAFEMLFKARGASPFAIHLTYEIDHIDVLRKADWDKEQTKEKNRKAAGGKKEPRADWSRAKQGLGSFFTPGRLAAGQELRIVGKSAPHVIDLLDPLGF
jgi:hypothetical protein